MNDQERYKGLQQLRDPFPADAIGKLPRGGQEPKTRCQECGGYHKSGAIHLDYVGHAEATDRLLTVDPEWTWEPLALNDLGLPKFITTDTGQPVGLWIKLTVCGVTRLGYGSCEPGKFDAVKELIGDAIRNAAMRFGVALDLWAKGDLESRLAGLDEEAEPSAAKTQTGSEPVKPAHTPEAGDAEPQAHEASPSDGTGDGHPSGSPSSVTVEDLLFSHAPGRVLSVARRVAQELNDEVPASKAELADLRQDTVEAVAKELEKSA